VKHSQVFKVLSHFFWNVSHQFRTLFLAADINCLNKPISFTQAFLGNMRIPVTHEKFISFYGTQIFIIIFTNLLAALLKLQAVRNIKLSFPNIVVNIFFLCAIRSYQLCQLHMQFSRRQRMLSVSLIIFLFYYDLKIFLQLQFEDALL
jgi:hypothetical protein